MVTYGCIPEEVPKFRAPLLLLLLSTAVQAQQPSQPPAVRSPEVSADRRVTFRVRAPSAAKVTVFCECLTSEPAMTKDADGVWSVTVGPLEPDIYEYHFTVDGVDNLDQRTGRQVQQPAESDRERRRGAWPGADVLRRQVRATRQGRDEILPVENEGMSRRAFVYTPPNYERG